MSIYGIDAVQIFMVFAFVLAGVAVYYMWYVPNED